MLSFLVVFHLRSEISLRFSRFSPTCFSIFDVKKFMKEKNMNENEFEILTTHAIHYLGELYFETKNEQYWNMMKKVRDLYFNID